jgi:hypothetical protein
MSKRISIILPVNNIEESDLSIPISSINNQIGIDFHDVELLLVDNGTYKLEHPEAFDLFRNVDLHYLVTDQVMENNGAIQFGIDAAQGDYVTVLTPNQQLHQAPTLQSYFALSDAHPDAESINGIVTTQYFDKQRVAHYQVGRMVQSIAGRWLKRDFLQNNHIRFQDDFGPYAEEYVSRLVNQLATNAVNLEDYGVMKFTSRALPNEDRLQMPINATWMKMMAQYFQQLQQADQLAYMNEFARFTIRFYTQLKSVPVADRTSLQNMMKTTVGANALAWAPTLTYVKQVRTKDQSPAAPWNAESKQFDHYLDSLSDYLNAYGLQMNVHQERS